MEWRFNAYCPKGHLQTLRLDVGPTAMVIVASPECETCESLATTPPTLTWRERWAIRRELRRERKALKSWDGDL